MVIIMVVRDNGRDRSADRRVQPTEWNNESGR